MTAIDDLLARARERIDRVEPAEALAEMRDGAVLVCDGGYQSWLAAANLRELGLRRATQKTRKRSRGRYTCADA